MKEAVGKEGFKFGVWEISTDPDDLDDSNSEGISS